MSAQKSDISCNLCRFPVYRWSGTGEGPARDVARDVGHRTDVDRSDQFYDGAREVPCGARVSGNLAKRAKKFKIWVLQECPERYL